MTDVTFSVRAAEPADVPALAVLVRREAEYQQSLTDSFELNPNADWPAYVTARLKRNNATILVAESEGKLAGFADIRVVQRGEQPKAAKRRVFPWIGRTPPPQPAPPIRPSCIGFVDSIFVEPEFRRRGGAVALMQSAETWFVTRNVRQLEAAIWVGNDISSNLFDRLRFEPSRILVKKYIS